jgi:hypothetical protein
MRLEDWDYYPHCFKVVKIYLCLDLWIFSMKTRNKFWKKKEHELFSKFMIWKKDEIIIIEKWEKIREYSQD